MPRDTLQSQSFGVWRLGDDYVEGTNPAERRKRQYREAQRAYRKRKHLQHFAELAAATETSTGTDTHHLTQAKSCPGNTLVSTQNHLTQQNVDDEFAWLLTISSKTRSKAIEFKQALYLNRSLSLKAPSNMGMLVRLNVLDAIASNAFALSISHLDLEQDDCISAFNKESPSTTDSLDRVVPANLRPTATQKSVVHHPWVDVFPISGIRDNILLGIQSETIDEDELCEDLFKIDDTEGRLMIIDDTEGAIAPIAVWGEPSEVGCWEFSPAFLRKWAVLLQGCPEVIDATNLWRTRRGKKKLRL